MEPTHLPDMREWWGYGYVYIGETVGKTLHTTLACNSGKRVDSAPRVYHVEKVGNQLVIESTTNTDRFKYVVEECEKCPPPIEWDWQDQAACFGVYPSVDMHDITMSKANIKQFCDTCPVVVECLDFAEINKQRGGVYGGIWIGEITGNANKAINKRRAEL